MVRLFRRKSGAHELRRRRKTKFQAVQVQRDAMARIPTAIGYDSDQDSVTLEHRYATEQTREPEDDYERQDKYGGVDRNDSDDSSMQPAWREDEDGVDLQATAKSMPPYMTAQRFKDLETPRDHYKDPAFAMMSEVTEGQLTSIPKTRQQQHRLRRADEDEQSAIEKLLDDDHNKYDAKNQLLIPHVVSDASSLTDPQLHLRRKMEKKKASQALIQSMSYEIAEIQSRLSRSQEDKSTTESSSTKKNKRGIFRRNVDSNSAKSSKKGSKKSSGSEKSRKSTGTSKKSTTTTKIANKAKPADPTLEPVPPKSPLRRNKILDIAKIEAQTQKHSGQQGAAVPSLLSHDSNEVDPKHAYDQQRNYMPEYSQRRFETDIDEYSYEGKFLEGHPLTECLRFYSCGGLASCVEPLLGKTTPEDPAYKTTIQVVQSTATNPQVEVTLDGSSVSATATPTVVEEPRPEPPIAIAPNVEQPSVEESISVEAEILPDAPVLNRTPSKVHNVSDLHFRLSEDSDEVRQRQAMARGHNRAARDDLSEMDGSRRSWKKQPTKKKSLWNRIVSS